ncbi:IgA receptor [Drosophila grimshawi]|uniref:GH24395 n=1 Tax=Drosophila grimshawi TaxID=7222 RepID=B4JM52_DROGR|nr:IgA receptor [Drosophila grimshawi]EDV91813.1 GH24395 [Drosophila grimshawi]
MSGDVRRGRRRRIEPARIQYGAWDDPCVSLFATVPQEPVADMLSRLKRLPQENRNRLNEMDASPLIVAPSNETNRMYREVKYQVQQIADDRSKQKHHSMQEKECQTTSIARTMAEHKRKELAEAMRRKQLHNNSLRLRDLHIEINRAKTTLSVVQKRNENMQTVGAERAERHREAQQVMEKVRDEKLAEERALQMKSQVYSEQLVAQIHKVQADRHRQQQSALEEGRQKRHNDEMADANDLQQAIVRRHKKRDELKHMLDECAELQRKMREANAAHKSDKLDVIVMEAVSPVTKSFINQQLQQRHDDIERRRRISDGLGQQLTEMRSKKDAHDNMLADILICERQAREKKRAHQDIQKRCNQKLQVAKDLIGQQEEQQFYRDKDEALTATIPITPTCFMERQYQQASEREATTREINLRAHQEIAIDIEHNAQVRAALVEEERQIKQALHEMELDMERRIDEERMRLLHEQSPQIINELRPCKLSHVERQTFNLPSCIHDAEDTHTK